MQIVNAATEPKTETFTLHLFWTLCLVDKGHYTRCMLLQFLVSVSDLFEHKNVVDFRVHGLATQQ